MTLSKVFDLVFIYFVPTSSIILFRESKNFFSRFWLSDSSESSSIRGWKYSQINLESMCITFPSGKLIVKSGLVPFSNTCCVSYCTPLIKPALLKISSAINSPNWPLDWVPERTLVNLLNSCFAIFIASSVLLFCFLSKSFVVTNFTVSCIVLSYCLVIKSLTVCKSLLNLSSFSASNSLTLFSTPSVVLSVNSLNFIPEKYFEKRVKNII